MYQTSEAVDWIRNSAVWVDAGGLVATAGGIAKGFEWVDGALNDKGRLAISNWLINLPPDQTAQSWPGAFADIIDRIFTKKPLSIRFFFRSCLASLAAFVIVVAIYARLHTEYFYDLEHDAVVLLLFAAANLVPDYFSVIISRAIVHQMARRPTSAHVFALLALDTLLKTILATCVIFLGSLVFMGILSIGFPDVHPWAVAFGNLRSFYATFPRFNSRSGLPVLGILFYSSFFTSAWVWFYVLGGLLIKALVKTSKLWHRLAPFLDLQANPLKSIGRVIGAISLVMGALFFALIHISKWS